MMDVVTDLIDSDVIFIERIAYELHSPSPGPSGPGSQKNICKTKRVPDLNFKLNTKKDLGVKDFDFDIEFVGTASAPNADGTTKIQWIVNEALNIDISVGAPGPVHLENIIGTINASVSPLQPPHAGNACDGGERSFGVVINSIGTENKLDIHGNILGFGLDITMDKIELNALAGKNLNSQVIIKSEISDSPFTCVGKEFDDPSFVLHFTSHVINLKPPLQYTWTSNGTINNPNSDNTPITFEMRRGKQIFVDLKVTDADGSSAVGSFRTTIPSKPCSITPPHGH